MTFHGVEFFKIGPNGNLTGEWTNNYLVGQIGRETATKVTARRSIVGSYDTEWTDPVGARTTHRGQLDIIARGNSFDFYWTENDELVFKGIGIRSRNSIAVSYWKVE